MDLHDYKDVAENYDRYLVVMFETNNAHEGFQEFYLELAKRHGQMSECLICIRIC